MRGILVRPYPELWLRCFEYEPLLQRYHLCFVFFITISAYYTVLEVNAAQRSSVTFAVLRVSIIWQSPALLYARMCSVQSERRWRSMKGSCLSGPALRSSQGPM